MNDFDQRFCFDCKFFYFTLGEPDLSDITPGTSAAMSCEKLKFHYRQGDDYNLGRVIRQARTCQDFEAAKGNR